MADNNNTYTCDSIAAGAQIASFATYAIDGEVNRKMAFISKLVITGHFSRLVQISSYARWRCPIGSSDVRHIAATHGAVRRWDMPHVVLRYVASRRVALRRIQLRCVPVWTLERNFFLGMFVTDHCMAG